MCKFFLRFMFAILAFMGFGSVALAVTPYDDLVTAADITGLTTTVLAVLVGVVGLVICFVAYVVMSNALKKILERGL